MAAPRQVAIWPMIGNWKKRLRIAFLWVLFAPFLLLSMTAPDVMPVRSDSGALMLVICTGKGMVEVAVDPQTFTPLPEDAPKAPEKHSDDCDWTNAHSQIALNTPLQLPAHAGRITMADVAGSPVILAVSRATGLPPATGPPAFI